MLSTCRSLYVVVVFFGMSVELLLMCKVVSGKLYLVLLEVGIN